MGAGPGQRWTFSPLVSVQRERFSDLGTPFSSHIHKKIWGSGEKKIWEEELKTLEKADDKNKAGRLLKKQKKSWMMWLPMATLLKLPEPTANPAPNPAWLPRAPRASLRLFPCPQTGVDPQLYVTITISIIIVLVATGIIFKFW